jgi:hypothetical protein
VTVGEASRKRKQILFGQRCIYCERAADTVEHMPPLSIFRDRDRPSGLEFPACRTCNNGTGASDLVAGFVAFLGNNLDGIDWRIDAAKARKGRLRQKAPGVWEEIFEGKSTAKLVEHRGVLREALSIDLGGQRTRAYLNIFAAKVGMALYREHVGEPIPLSGGIETIVAINLEHARHLFNSVAFMLPEGRTLTQGRKSVGDQFWWQFNTDLRSIVAAYVSIHDGLSIVVFSTAEPETYGFPSGLENSCYSKPATLAAMMEEAKRS